MLPITPNDGPMAARPQPPGLQPDFQSPTESTQPTSSTLGTVGTKKRRNLRLTERDQTILDILIRYRLLLPSQLLTLFTLFSPRRPSEPLRMQGVQTRLNELRDNGLLGFRQVNGTRVYSATDKATQLLRPEYHDATQPADIRIAHTIMIAETMIGLIVAGHRVLSELDIRRDLGPNEYGVLLANGQRHYPDAVIDKGGWGHDEAIEVELTVKSQARYAVLLDAFKNGQYAKVHYWVPTSGMGNIIRRLVTDNGAGHLITVNVITDASVLARVLPD